MTSSETYSLQPGANLIGANLAGFDLRNLDFTGSDFTDAILENADLRGANLTNATLSGADFRGANLFQTIGLDALSSAQLDVVLIEDVPPGAVGLVGVIEQGATLTAVTSSLLDAKGFSSLSYQWFADDVVIADQTKSILVLSQTEVGKAIAVKVSYTDESGSYEGITSDPIDLVIGVTIGTSESDEFEFALMEQGGHGYIALRDFDSLEDELVLTSYTPSKIIKTLDGSGYDKFVFTEDSDVSTLVIETAEVASSLKISNLANKTLKLASGDLLVNEYGELSLSSTKEIDGVKVDGVSSFKTDIKLADDTNASDPISIGDVIAQIKHIIGMKELKSYAHEAGDTNNDGDVNLTDVLATIKHIIGREELNTFDLVTDNGFTVNALDAESKGNLKLVINGDADQSHADWISANESPTLVIQTGSALTEDSQISTITGRLEGSDPENGSLTYSVLGVNSLPGSNIFEGNWGTMTLHASTGIYTYVLNNFGTSVQSLGAGETATETFKVQVSDGVNTSIPKDLNFNILGSNDSPSSVKLSINSINENISGPVKLGYLSAEDFDIEDTHTFVLRSDSQKFKIEGNEVTYLGSGENYEDTQKLLFDVAVSDGVVSSVHEVTVEILNVNEAPFWDEFISTQQAVEGQEYFFDLSSISNDQDNDDLNYKIVDAPDWLDLDEEILQGTPDGSDVGGTDITITIDDGTLSSSAKINFDVVMSDTDAPKLLSFTVDPSSDGVLGAPDSIKYTATASETMRSDTSMSITLSNDVTVNLEVDPNARNTLVGTYEINSGDPESADLTITQYSGLNAVDISGNALDTSKLVSEIPVTGPETIEVDAQAPTAAISLTGHTYDALGGVLTLAASDLLTLDVVAGVAGVASDMKSQLDMTKLIWDVNQSGNGFAIFENSDVQSAIATDAETLEITFVSSKQIELANTSNLGGQGGANLDGLDITAGFMSDAAGNVSTQSAVENAAVVMSDTDGPKLLRFTVDPSSDGVLGAPDSIKYTATASETMRSDTSINIALSNDVTVNLEVDPNARDTLVGTYEINSGDPESADLTITQYSGLTAVDISGNALDTSKLVSEIPVTGPETIEVDAQAPTAAISLTGHTYDALGGVLTLAASDLLTLDVVAGVAGVASDMKSQLDMTKLIWDVNQSGNGFAIFENSDVQSAIATDAETLEITFVSSKQIELANTSNLGGQGGANLDGLDITAGFMSDAAGNVSTQSAVENAAVVMSDTDGPKLLRFTVDPSSDGVLGAPDSIKYTATASETMRSDTSMSITLSNDVTVNLEVDPNARNTLVGTYEINSGDPESADLTITQYSGLNAVDISGNALDTSKLVSEIPVTGPETIEVDAQAPTAAISLTGHTYDALGGVLTLAASDLLTLDVVAGVAGVASDMKSQLDMTKLIWDVNQSGNGFAIFENSDVQSAIATDAETLEITFVSSKQIELANTSNLGGQGGANLDGLDITAGFMSDAAGNVSTQSAVENAAVVMSDTDGPKLLRFTVDPSSDGVLGAPDSIKYTATASETMRSDTSINIALSNDVTVNLEVDPNARDTLVGTYEINSGDPESADLTITQYSSLTAVDISGNALDTSKLVSEISVTGPDKIEVDAQAPTAIGIIEAGVQSLRLLFDEEISNQIDISSILKELEIVPDAAEPNWSNSGQMVVVETTQTLAAGDFSINLSIADLYGNIRTIDEIQLYL